MTTFALDSAGLPATAMPEPRSDEALVRRACAGDEAAYAAIYRRYHARIEAYCRAIVRHDEDARDAAQTAMTKALVAMRSERGAAHLRPWLFRIAHNEALTVLRRRRHHHELTEALEGRDTDPVIEVLLREELRTMLDALRALPASHREALLLRELGGLEYDTVAAVVGMTPRAARQAVFRARATLRSDRLAGDESQCPEIRRLLAGRDGRRRRARKVRAHLRACDACREWDAARPARGRALCAVPAALASAASSLWSWFGGAAAGGPGSISAAAAAKVVTGVALIAAGTAPSAEREIVARHVARTAPAKQAARTAPAKQAARTAGAKQAVRATTKQPAPTRAATATPSVPRVATPPAPRTARATPQRRTAPTTVPDRHATAPRVRSSPQAARAGAPRGRDGAPGGRGPSDRNTVPPRR